MILIDFVNGVPQPLPLSPSRQKKVSPTQRWYSESANYLGKNGFPGRDHRHKGGVDSALTLAMRSTPWVPSASAA